MNSPQPSDRVRPQASGQCAPGASSADDFDAVESTACAVLPWLVSVTLHAAVVLLTVFLVWAAAVRPPVPEYAVNLGSNQGGSDGQLQGKDQPESDPLRNADRAIPRTAADRPRTEYRQVATGPKWRPAGAIGGTRPEMGPGPGPRTTDPTVFENPGPDRSGSYAFVLDASGSLIDGLPFVKRELRWFLERLVYEEGRQTVRGRDGSAMPREPVQHRFTVIFFKGEQAVELGEPGLKKATSSNVKAVLEQLEQVIAEGRSTPVPALQKALAYRPDVLYVLSDAITGRGRWELRQGDLLAAVARANAHGRTAIHTIQFLYPDPLVLQGMAATLGLMAEQHGGSYKYLDARELSQLKRN